MLNKCPKRCSCGTYAGMWTDEDMPTAIGISTNVTAYASYSLDYSNNCRYATTQVEVMRCSLINHDFIYRYINNTYYNIKYPDICDLAFCGMM